MATAVEPRSTEALRSGAGLAVAEVFVVFGITGDLAKVMTSIRCTGWRSEGS